MLDLRVSKTDRLLGDSSNRYHIMQLVCKGAILHAYKFHFYI